MATLLSGFLSEVSFSSRTERVFHTFSTNYRKRSKRRRNNSRHHTRSRCITSLCTAGVPTTMSLRPKKTVLRGRLPMDRLLVLTHYPTKQTSQASPKKSAHRGRLPLHRLFLSQSENGNRSFLESGVHQVGKCHPGPALFPENLQSLYAVGAALSNIYAKQGSGRSLCC